MNRELNTSSGNVMKTALQSLIIALGIVALAGCEDGGRLLDAGQDTAPLIPETPVDDGADDPRPPEGAAVISTNAHQIFDAFGQPILLRGSNVLFSSNKAESLPGVTANKAAGANVVRIQLGPNVTAENLELALEGVVNNGLVAMLVYDDPEVIACQQDEEALVSAIEDYWLGEWLPVLVQERFQPHIMINIAAKWGITDVWNQSSDSYDEYIDSYKNSIGQFREAGFKVPLVVDAPGCGEDYFAFMGLRSLELLAADEEANLVLSVYAYGSRWNNEDKIRTALADLSSRQMPFVISEFGGSGLNGEKSLDHLQLMEIGLGDPAMVLNLPWSSTEDKAAYVHSLETPINLVGSTVTFDLYVPGRYVRDGSLAVEFYAKDSNYLFGSVSQNVATLRSDAWNRLRYTFSDVVDFNGSAAEGFDPSSVRQIGIQVSANGKPVDLAGFLIVDNFSIVSGDTSGPLFTATFDSNTNDFMREFGAGENDPDAVTQGDGQLLILPDWSANSGMAVAYDNRTTSYGDLAEPFTIKFDVFIPEEYSSDGLAIQPYIRDREGRYAALEYWSADQLKFGETHTLTLNMDNLAAHIAGEMYEDAGFLSDGVPNALGFEIKNVASAKSESIRIDNFEFYGPEGESSGEGVLDFASDNGGFVREWGAGDMEASAVIHSDGELHLQPTWGTGETMIAVATGNSALLNTISLENSFSMTMELFIPAIYEAETLELQPYIRDGANNYAQLAYYGDAQITTGQWQTITVEVVSVADNGMYKDGGFEAMGVPGKLGFEFKGVTSAKEEPVRVDNVTLTAASEPNAEQEVVLSLDFSTVGEVDSFVFDFGGGDLDETALVGAKYHGYGVAPYSWIASAWWGSEESRAALDISHIPGFTGDPSDTSTELGLDLTERGESIVNGTYGIRATSVPATFTQSEQ